MDRIAGQQTMMAAAHDMNADMAGRVPGHVQHLQAESSLPFLAELCGQSLACGNAKT